MHDELDTLLRQDLLEPPDEFTQQVMRAIATRHPKPAMRPHSLVWQRVRWLAASVGLVGGGALGLIQVAGFVFGIWTASSAI